MNAETAKVPASTTRDVRVPKNPTSVPPAREAEDLRELVRGKGHCGTQDVPVPAEHVRERSPRAPMRMALR